MRRLFFCLAFFSAIGLYAQIPIALIIDGLDYAAENVWRPDWPLEIPPDAFKFQSGEIYRCEVVGEDLFLEFRIGREGEIERYPFMLNGRMAQVSIVYGQSSRIVEMVLNFASGEDPWRLEVLEHRNSYPFLVRGSSGGVWYFIYLTQTVNEIHETWHDVDGNFLGAYSYSLTEIDQKSRIRTIRDFSNTEETTEFFYDSRGFITDISGPYGFFRALYYRDKLPRYWERRPANGASGTGLGSSVGNFILQWDANDALIRTTGLAENEGRSLDHRYEYDIDENGNWIERLELQMVRIYDLLVGTPGNTFRRFLEYSE